MGRKGVQRKGMGVVGGRQGWTGRVPKGTGRGKKRERCDYQGKPEELKWGLSSSSGMGKFGRAQLGEYRSGRGKRETCNYQGKPEELKWGLISSGWLVANGMGWHGSRKNSNGKTEELKWEFRPKGGCYLAECATRCTAACTGCDGLVGRPEVLG